MLPSSSRQFPRKHYDGDFKTNGGYVDCGRDWYPGLGMHATVLTSYRCSNSDCECQVVPHSLCFPRDCKHVTRYTDMLNILGHSTPTPSPRRITRGPGQRRPRFLALGWRHLPCDPGHEWHRSPVLRTSLATYSGDRTQKLGSLHTFDRVNQFVEASLALLPDGTYSVRVCPSLLWRPTPVG